jgi:hypothetical protein
MARKAHEPDSDTTVVNIADFQRTRDSVCSSSLTFFQPILRDALLARMTRL